ncbi:butyrophilin subfamily 1 member A1-like isoform X1 [Oreochromis aureus]|uniref:butyrophilin subfamily 1 member A1-like isoform X1 n=1 Tax=Oreochromis aureus TaxID=47969 RepID=UPI001953D181|nr:butyrophilin subfamily 1 member A1-like isoform X1 [Oreochromis aureus]
MELLPLLSLSFCFLTLSGLTFGAESGPPDTRVIVMEDDDVILPCSLSTNQNIEKELFVWKKEGTVPLKVVFMFDAGTYSRGQDDEFSGRVSHFPEQLKYGNTSIRMSKTKLEDRGIYTCSFPVMQPSVKTSRIELVVEPVLKVRNVPGAAQEPYVTNCDHTNDWALLQCDVKNAYPKPTVEWQDSKNQIIPSGKPQVSKTGDRFHITLNTTVKKTDRYRCVATQKEINHQAHTNIYVYFRGDRSGTGMMRATIVSIIFGIIGIVVV